MILEIEIPKEKENEVIGVLKALGVKINKKNKTLNQETIKAIEDARAGKINKIDNITTFMDNF